MIRLQLAKSQTIWKVEMLNWLLQAWKRLHDLGYLNDSDDHCLFQWDEEALEMSKSLGSDFIERAQKHEVALGLWNCPRISVTVTVAQAEKQRLELKTQEKQSILWGIQESVWLWCDLWGATDLELNSEKNIAEKNNTLTFNPGTKIIGGFVISLTITLQEKVEGAW